MNIKSYWLIISANIRLQILWPWSQYMPEETSTVPSVDDSGTEEPAPKKKIIIAGIIVLLVIVAGFAIWYLMQPVAPPENNPTPTPSIGGEETPIVWLVYSNDKYGYSLQYPQNWYLNKTQADRALSNGLGGEVIISNKDKAMEVAQLEQPPLDMESMTLSVYQTGAAATIDQFIKDKNFVTPLNQADTEVGTLPAKQLVYVYDRQDFAKQILDIATLVKKDTKMFVFHYYTFIQEKNILPQDVVSINDAILKSFEIK